MTMPNAAELEMLKHIFQNLDWANIGDAAGLQNSATAGSLYIALLTGDPGETGDIANNEVDVAGGEYAQYLRVAVTRDATEWEDNGSNGLQNGNAITFAKMTSGSGVTVTHFAICKGSTMKTDDAIVTGALSASLAVSANITPEFAAGDLDVTAD